MKRKLLFKLRYQRRTRTSRFIFAVVLTAVVVLATLLAYSAIVEQYANKVVAQSIRDLVERQSQGKYVMNYDSLAIDVWNSRVFIDHFKLDIDRLKGQQEVPHKTFQTSIVSVQLNVDGLWRLWLDDVMRIQKAILTQPKIQITEPAKSQTRKLAAETGDLISQLNEHLDILNIKELQINNAALSFFRQSPEGPVLRLKIPDLSLQLSGLLWQADQAINNAEREVLFISIKDQEFVLPDSSASLRVDSMSYSLSKNELNLSNAEIQTLTTQDTEDLSKLKFENLVFSGINLQQAYEQNTLAIDSVQLINPDVLLHSQILPGQKAIQRSNPSTSIIDSLSISKIKIIKGEFDITLPFAQDDFLLRVNKFNAELQNLSIGGEVAENVSYDQIKFNLQNVNGSTQDSTHCVIVKLLNYDQELKKLTVDSLEVRPNKTSSDGTLTASIPSLELTGIDQTDFQNNRLELSELVVTRPDIEVSMAFTAASANSKSKTDFPLSIKRVRVEKLNGSFKDNSQSASIRDGDINLSNFDLASMLDSARNGLKDLNYQLFFTELRYGNTNSRLNARLENLRGSSNSRTIKSSRVALNSAGFYLEMQRVALSNEKPWSATKLDSIHLDFLVFSDYSLELKPVAEKQKAKSPVFEIDSVFAVNGSTSYSGSDSSRFNVLIPKLKLKDVTLSADDVALNYYDLLLRDLEISKPGLTLRLDQLNANASTQKTIFENLFLKQQRKRLITEARLDRLILSDTKFNRLSAFQDRIKLGELMGSGVKVTRVGQSDSDRRKVDLDILWPKELPELSVEQLEIRDIAYESNVDGIYQKLYDTQFMFDNILLSAQDDLRLLPPDHFLFAERINGSIAKFEQQGNNQTLNVANIRIDSDVTTGQITFLDVEKDTSRVEMDSLSIRHIFYNDLFKDQLVKAEEVSVYQPLIYATVRASENQRSKSSPAFSFEQLHIHNAVIDITSADKERLQLAPVDMELRGFYYDSLVDFNKTLVPAEAINLSTYDLTFTTGDGLNKVFIDKINLTNKNNEVDIQNIRFKPQLTREDYTVAVGVETDWIEGQIPEIQLIGLDYRQFLKERAIIASQIRINQPKLNVYRDKNFINPPAVGKSLPQTLLKDQEIKIGLDSILIIDGTIRYSEVPEKGTKAGTISFGQLNAKMENVTNLPDRINQNSVMQTRIKSSVMDQIPVTVAIDFHLDSELNKFELSGEVPPHSMTLFNPFTEDGAFLKIKSGNCRSLEFSAVADDNVGYGSMYFQYNDFKVALVDKKTANTKKIEESIASFMANTFIVKKRNLAILKLREGDIFFERNKNKSIFNYFSKLFTSGVASSVGLKNHKKDIKQLHQGL